MIPGVRCKTCIFWADRAHSEYGHCHRFPPRPLITDEAGETVQRDVRPLTTGKEWCGEWRSKSKRETVAEVVGGVRLN